jgi:acetyltransferase-like isoleucine patch superfamily enzyme
LLKRIRRRLQYELGKFFSPQVIGKYKRHDGTVLRKTRISNTALIGDPEKLDIEDNVFVFHYTIIDASNGVTIKEGCQVGAWVGIFSHSSHISIRLYGKHYGEVNPMKGYVKGPVYIGEYTFIGPHSIIMPGTRIGKGSIVSAYSYVEGEFPDFAIISGNPAKVVGDTRKIDKRYLDNDPQLRAYYAEWSGE